MCRVCVSRVRDRCTKYQVTVQPYAQCDSFGSMFLVEDRQFAEP